MDGDTQVAEAPFITKHKLGFDVRPYHTQIDPSCIYMDFRVGTCSGLYIHTKISYSIVAIKNDAKGNGHFDDVIQWFERSCRRDGKSLRFLEIENKKLYNVLTKRMGFADIRNNNVEKIYS